MKNGAFCWNELMTPDLKKSKDFYKSLFGWEFEEHKMDANKSYTMIKIGNDGIGGMMQTPSDKANIPPHWMSYVNVDNLEKAIAKAQSLGATIKVPKTQAGEFGFFSIIADSVGAHIALWEVAAKT